MDNFRFGLVTFQHFDSGRKICWPFFRVSGDRISNPGIPRLDLVSRYELGNGRSWIFMKSPFFRTFVNRDCRQCRVSLNWLSRFQIFEFEYSSYSPFLICSVRALYMKIIMFFIKEANFYWIFRIFYCQIANLFGKSSFI